MNIIDQFFSADDFSREAISLDRLFLDLETRLDMELPEEFGLVSPLAELPLSYGSG